MDTSSYVVKIGGAAAQDREALEALAGDIDALRGGNARTGSARVALVHGGGDDVTAVGRKLDIQPAFSQGIRMTSEAGMAVVDMVLCGLVNKRLVRVLVASGVPAVGVSGADAGLLTGSTVRDDAGRESRTAHVSAVDSTILDVLWRHGFVPVVASPGSDADGGSVNINADEAAFAIGTAVGAQAIVFLSDVAGVLGRDGTAIAALPVPQAEALIQEKLVTGGMIAKIRNAAAALDAGVGHIVIGKFETTGDLSRLLSGQAGTVIGREQS